ncbi:MAG: hypothetical protein HWE10_14845 [Gammaproteobacteria bacterium]|nr:hypothetical protein [Gammaproteobacteria bacterium]
MKSIFLFALMAIQFTAVAADNLRNNLPPKTIDKNFPWELVIEQGKIRGCFYEEHFYSLGSILILESLPRKCELTIDKIGNWAQLSESELLLYKENIKAQKEAEQESESSVSGSVRLTKDERMLLNHIRTLVKKSARSK